MERVKSTYSTKIRPASLVPFAPQLPLNLFDSQDITLLAGGLLVIFYAVVALRARKGHTVAYPPTGGKWVTVSLRNSSAEE